MQEFSRPLLRPVRQGELGYVRVHLALAVDELLGAESDFARFEKARFAGTFLVSLIEADPGFVVIVQTLQGQRAGFIIGVPEMGAIVLSWGYIEPRFRKGTLAMRAFGEFVRQWDHRNYDKIIYYALPSNRQSEAIGRHAKFETVGLLRRHFYGQDFVMYQKFYNKDLPGYAKLPASKGLSGRMVARFRRLLQSCLKVKQ